MAQSPEKTVSKKIPARLVVKPSPHIKKLVDQMLRERLDLANKGAIEASDPQMAGYVLQEMMVEPLVRDKDGLYGDITKEFNSVRPQYVAALAQHPIGQKLALLAVGPEGTAQMMFGRMPSRPKGGTYTDGYGNELEKREYYNAHHARPPKSFSRSDTIDEAQETFERHQEEGARGETRPSYQVNNPRNWTLTSTYSSDNHARNYHHAVHAILHPQMNDVSKAMAEGEEIESMKLYAPASVLPIQPALDKGYSDSSEIAKELEKRQGQLKDTLEAQMRKEVEQRVLIQLGGQVLGGQTSIPKKQVTAARKAIEEALEEDGKRVGPSKLNTDIAKKFLKKLGGEKAVQETVDAVMAEPRGRGKKDPSFNEQVEALTSPKISPSQKKAVGQWMEHLEDYSQKFEGHAPELTQEQGRMAGLYNSLYHKKYLAHNQERRNEVSKLTAPFAEKYLPADATLDGKISGKPATRPMPLVDEDGDLLKKQHPTVSERIRKFQRENRPVKPMPSPNRHVAKTGRQKHNQKISFH